MEPRIVVSTQRPLLKAAVAVIAAALLVLGGWLLYSHARNSTGVDFAKAESEREALEQQQRELGRELRSAKAEINRLRGELAYAKQSESIDGEACKAVKATLAQIENESAKLREQLAFYKGIVDPKDARAGVRVQEIKIRPAGDHLHYELVLIQAVREENRIAGNAELAIQGINTREPAAGTQLLPLKSLVTTGDKDLVFSFKYYEEFAGDFQLPQGFKPEKLIVTMKAVNDRPVATEEFPWDSIAHTEELTRD